MNHLLFIIVFALTLTGCIDHQVDVPKDILLTSPILLEDSIDRYGYSGCRKPFDSTAEKLCLKALDSLWIRLVQNNKTHQEAAHYSKENFKNELINNGFKVDTSLLNETAGTKKGFNERWRAEWDNDSNYVQLMVTRWYHGHTHAFFIGSDKFDK